MSTEEIKPKIIIDEDWKEKAQAEKAALSQESPPAAGATAAGEAPPQPEKTARGPLPPASFATLVSTLATQAMLSLGQFAHPETGQAELDLPGAKHFIDMLQVLEDKTKGNLTAEEADMLSNLVHELRMGYVAIRNRHGEAGNS